MKSIAVEIFKTNIDNNLLSATVAKKLSILFPKSKINFDLDDCDKILRMEGSDFTGRKVIGAIEELGYQCEILE